jgi:hypothetical protein
MAKWDIQSFLTVIKEQRKIEKNKNRSLKANIFR